MRFFFDNNLSRHLSDGMRGFQEDTTHLLESFEPGEEDATWLKEIGNRGWFLVTRDERIRKKPAELMALQRHSVGAFFLGGKSRTRCQLIQQLVRCWPRMKETASNTARPFAFRVPPHGKRLDRIQL